ncbi:MAG: hypothetical protein ACRD2I_26570 [Vicinamibacterales bacterium]
MRRIWLLLAFALLFSGVLRWAGLPRLSPNGDWRLVTVHQREGRRPRRDPEPFAVRGIGVVMLTQLLPFYKPVSKDVIKRSST